MKRSVLIVAEGEHELMTGESDAALPRLVQRLVGSDVELQSTSRRIKEFARHVHPGRGNRLGRKFISIIRQAEREEFDSVVVLIDQDSDKTRHKSADFAQNTTITSIPRAIGIAVRTFDAWFLADHIALAKVCGATVDPQADPETHRDPKTACECIVDDAGSPIRLRDLYSALAEYADLELLRERCPKGFGVFADRVESLKLR